MTPSTAVDSSGDLYTTLEQANAEPASNTISGRKQNLLLVQLPCNYLNSGLAEL